MKKLLLIALLIVGCGLPPQITNCNSAIYESSYSDINLHYNKVESINEIKNK